MVEQNAFLQWPQRIDILNIGDTSGNLGDDLVNVILCQCHQWQHLRCNGLTTVGDEIRRHVLYASASSTIRRFHYQTRRHRRQCWRRKDGADIQIQTALAQLFNQADHQQGMPTQFKEIVLTPDLFQPQQGLPDNGQLLLHLSLRSLIFTADGGGVVGCRQRLAIQFAVRVQREGIQYHECTRQHIFSQVGAQLFAQAGGIQCDIGLRYEVRHQTFIAADLFTCHHHGITDPCTGSQLRLNFAQFNAKAADLDLKIIAAEIDNGAIRSPAAQIARPVHPGMGLFTEWVGHKTLSGEFRAVQITPGNACATNVDFSGDTDGDGLPLCIKNINVGIDQGTANRQGFHTIGSRVIQCQGSGTDRRFRWPVSVDPAAVPGFRHRLPGGEMTVFGFLTADRDRTYMGTETTAAGFHLLYPLVPEGGGQIDDADRLLLQEMTEGGIRDANMRRTQDQGRAD